VKGKLEGDELRKERKQTNKDIERRRDAFKSVLLCTHDGAWIYGALKKRQNHDRV